MKAFHVAWTSLRRLGIIFFQVWASFGCKTLEPDPDWYLAKMLDPDPNSMNSVSIYTDRGV